MTYETTLWQNLLGIWTRLGRTSQSPPQAPIISVFSPTSAPVGATITINGSSFTGASAVTFVGNGSVAPVDASTFTVVSATTMTVVVPAGATTGPISVTTPVGSGTSVGVFTFTAPPVVSSFSPTTGVVGATVSLAGSGFTGTTATSFAGTPALYTVVSSSAITTSVPTGATTGAISVTTPAGASSSPTSFTVTGGGSGVPTYATYTLALDEEFADLARWYQYDHDTFGQDHGMLQYYEVANNELLTTTVGATNGTSLRQITHRNYVNGVATPFPNGAEFTAGMISSKLAGRWYPRYGRYQIRVKIPHGQGMWPAFWLTGHGAGGYPGSGGVEIDVMEYFHAETPGSARFTLHRADNTGNLVTGVSKLSSFFEAPTYAPAWHTFGIDILPWTATTVGAGVAGNPANPAANVRFTWSIDGVVKKDYVDTQALWWTTNCGPDGDNFYNIYHQGGQVGGSYTGHPDDPLGYSRAYDGSRGGSAYAAKCINGGTPTLSCVQAVGGYNIFRAGRPGGGNGTFNLVGNETAVSYETDYIRVYKFTG